MWRWSTWDLRPSTRGLVLAPVGSCRWASGQAGLLLSSGLARRYVLGSTNGCAPRCKMLLGTVASVGRGSWVKACSTCRTVAAAVPSVCQPASAEAEAPINRVLNTTVKAVSTFHSTAVATHGDVLTCAAAVGNPPGWLSLYDQLIQESILIR